MTDSEFFIDTNLIVYMYDSTNQDKQRKIIALFQDCIKDELIVVSNQVLAEFFSVATRKSASPLPIPVAQEVIRDIITFQGIKKLTYTPQTVLGAAKMVEVHSVSFWDALIAATMLENNIAVIYTENEKDFSKIPGIKVINPLK